MGVRADCQLNLGGHTVRIAFRRFECLVRILHQLIVLALSVCCADLGKSPAQGADCWGFGANWQNFLAWLSGYRGYCGFHVQR